MHKQLTFRPYPQNDITKLKKQLSKKVYYVPHYSMDFI